MATNGLRSVRTAAVKKAVKALEGIVKEANLQGKKDKYVSLSDINRLAGRMSQRPDSLFFAWTAARTNGDTSIAGVVGRIRHAKKLIDRANADHNATVSGAERGTIKGAGASVAQSILNETTLLPKYLKKAKALRNK
jgi:hypothetical protein